MEIIDINEEETLGPSPSGRWGHGAVDIESDKEANTPLPEQPESPKKSPHKEPRKAVDGIGNDEIQNWLLSIVEAFNVEYKRRYERGEISDKNPIIIKGTRDLLDGFVIGLAIRAHCPNLVAPHNITRTLNRRQKLSNWQFLNERVFNKLGFKIEDQLIMDIVDHDRQRLIDFVLMIKNLLERDHPQKAVDPSSSNMMLRPLERIYKIPSILNSKRAKRKVSQLKAFHLLDPADQSILLEKEKVLVRHRVCIDELETRFLAVQGDIREKKQMIKRIEAGDPEDDELLNEKKTKKKCCCIIS